MVDLLWRANELDLTTDDSMSNIPRVFLPKRPAAITSLELTWEQAPGVEPTKIDACDIDVLFAALTALSGLRHLILTLRWRGGNWDHEPVELDAFDSEKSFLAWHDRFVNERLRLEHFTVATPESLEGSDEPIDEAEHKNKHTCTRTVRMNKTDENDLVILNNDNVTTPNPPAEFDKGKPVLDRG